MNKLKSNVKSVYIHIPFCNSICSYCDFCKIYYNEDIVNKYLDTLIEEIKSEYNGEKLQTIYIGGGTPSCLNYDQLVKLLEILDIFVKEEDCEITFECNIESINKEKLELLYNSKINRLSIGIESFNSDIIKFLNRKHTKEEAINKILMAKEIGFNNINIDLMYAITGESMEILSSDINTILSLDIEHISTYSLIIEPHTVLYNNKIDYIDEDIDYNMYQTICTQLNKNGYKHYEISNFAKEGYYSKHNLTYWNNLEYYGFGAGASGYINNVRYDNTRSITKYINKEYRLKEDFLSFNATVENEFILGLRKINGIDLLSFEEKYGFRVTDLKVIKRLLNEKKVVIKDGYLSIQHDYIYRENDILINFLDIDYEIVKTIF